MNDAALPNPAHIVLSGHFVRLRPLTAPDAAMTLAWRRSDRAAQLHAPPESIAAQEAWIVARPGHEYNFIIELAGGTPVGMLSLVDVDLRHRRAEPGRFLIGESELARGVPAAIEALMLLYEFAFEALALQRLYGTIASDNADVIKLQTYLGYKVEGTLRKHYYINERWQDAVCVGMLADEFRSVARPKMRAILAMSTSRAAPSSSELR